MAERYIVNVEAAIYNDEGKWLVIKRSQQEDHAPGALTLVGGKVEVNGSEDEVLEQTLRREVREEVGIEVDSEIRYLESKSFQGGDGQLVVDIVFLTSHRSGRAEVCDPEEVSEVHWLSLEEIRKKERAPAYLPGTVERAQAGLAGRR